jgi:hypothetical protein
MSDDDIVFEITWTFAFCAIKNGPFLKEDNFPSLERVPSGNATKQLPALKLAAVCAISRLKVRALCLCTSMSPAITAFQPMIGMYASCSTYTLSNANSSAFSMLSQQTALLKRMMNNCFSYGPHESITVRSEHSGALTMCG